MELESKPFLIDTPKWKNELKCNGFILCDRESCQMGFLSLRGMEVHRQKCTGHVNEGVCNFCNLIYIGIQVLALLKG